MVIPRLIPPSIFDTANQLVRILGLLTVLVCSFFALSSFASAAPASSAPQHDDAFIEEDVSYSNGDFGIQGTVLIPRGEETDLPALVLVAGAGEGVPRVAYRAHAEAFANEGIVTLIYDKRTAEHGYSMFDASIEDLADDAIAGVHVLRNRREVDPDRVGLHGHSEGTWTVVTAANRSEDVAFVITSAGSAWSPERTQVWMNTVHLHHAGVTDSLLTPLGETATRHIVDAGQFRLAGHDALGPLEQLDQPILGLFPELDRSSPPGESLKHYAEALDGGGNAHYELRVVPGADHEMWPSQDGFQHSAGGERAEGFVPEYFSLVTSWVDNVNDGPGEARADPPPSQPLESAELAPMTAYEVWFVQAAGPLIMLLTFGAYPVGALITRMRRGRTRPATWWPARIVAVLGLLLPWAAMGYLGYLMFTAAQSVGPVVLGRPIPWLLLQVGSVVTLVCGLMMVIQWVRHRQVITRGNRIRMILLAVGLVTFTLWSSYWGLLTL